MPAPAGAPANRADGEWPRVAAALDSALAAAQAVLDETRALAAQLRAACPPSPPGRDDSDSAGGTAS